MVDADVDVDAGPAGVRRTTQEVKEKEAASPPASCLTRWKAALIHPQAGVLADLG